MVIDHCSTRLQSTKHTCQADGYKLQSVSGCLDDTAAVGEGEKTALPFPQLSKVQVSVVPRCSGGGGPAQPALPTQCQPVSALLSSKKILRVTLTGPPLLATIITITIANTHFACRERCGQPEQHW